MGIWAPRLAAARVGTRGRAGWVVGAAAIAARAGLGSGSGTGGAVRAAISGRAGLKGGSGVTAAVGAGITAAGGARTGRGVAGGTTAVGRLGAHLMRPPIAGTPIGSFPIAVIGHGPVMHLVRRAHVAAAGPPPIRMRHAVNHRRPISERVIPVHVGVVVAAAMVIVVAVTIGIIAPAGIPGGHKQRSRKIAAPIAITIAITRARTVIAPAGRVIGVVSAGGECKCCRGSHRGGGPITKRFLHAAMTTPAGNLFEPISTKRWPVARPWVDSLGHSPVSCSRHS